MDVNLNFINFAIFTGIMLKYLNLLDRKRKKQRSQMRPREVILKRRKRMMAN